MVPSAQSAPIGPAAGANAAQPYTGSRKWTPCIEPIVRYRCRHCREPITPRRNKIYCSAACTGVAPRSPDQI